MNSVQKKKAKHALSAFFSINIQDVSVTKSDSTPPGTRLEKTETKVATNIQEA